MILLTTMAMHAMMFGHAKYLKVVETHFVTALLLVGLILVSSSRRSSARDG